MLDPFLEQLNHWDWWIFGMALIVLEVFAPGAVFIWLGFSSAIVGGLVFFMPDMSWENQFATFALLSIASVVIGRRYFQWRPIATDHPHLNRRGERYIGRTAKLESAIENGRGAVRLDDTIWHVSGANLPAGARVKITGTEGAMLSVEEDRENPD